MIKENMKEKLFPNVFLNFMFLSLLMTACGGIVSPPSELKPEVESTIPGDQERGVVLNKSISVTFNKEMSPETLTESTFFLREEPTGNPVPGKVTLIGATATFKPTNLLEGTKTFTATVTNEVGDLSGEAITQAHLWQFTTTASDSPGSTDDDAPVVVSTSPQNGAANVPTNTVITVIFSEEIDPTTVTLMTFEMSRGINAEKISVSGKVVSFVPSPKLDLGKDYKVTVTTGVKDLAGNPLASDFSWSFSTGSEAPDD